MTDDNANVSADLASMMDVMLNMYSNAVDRLGVPTASGEEHGLKCKSRDAGPSPFACLECYTLQQLY